MRLTRQLQAVWCLGALFVAGCDTKATPTPDAYERNIQYNILQGKRSCGLVMPPGVKAKELHFLPNGGGDKAILGPRLRLVLFDSSSPITAETHDTIVLSRAHPTGYQFHRIGADLLICGQAYWQEILVIRQYCHDATARPAWNNQFEEIAFPDARETWLADEIYDALPSDKDYPSAEQIRDLYEVDEEHARSAVDGWRVRPFRDVLPSSRFAAASCNEDLEAVLPK